MEGPRNRGLEEGNHGKALAFSHVRHFQFLETHGADAAGKDLDLIWPDVPLFGWIMIGRSQHRCEEGANQLNEQT